MVFTVKPIHTMTFTSINKNNNTDYEYPYYYSIEEGTCCVCLEVTSGRTQQFYQCANVGIHYICNYCYNEWQNQRLNNGCPTCRAQPIRRPVLGLLSQNVDSYTFEG